MEHLIHIIVAVLPEPTTEDHVRLSVGRQFCILLIEAVVGLVVDRVVGFISAVPVSRVFLGDDRLVGVTLAEFEVLVFDHPGIRGFGVRVVNDRVPLVVVNI